MREKFTGKRLALRVLIYQGGAWQDHYNARIDANGIMLSAPTIVREAYEAGKSEAVDDWASFYTWIAAPGVYTWIAAPGKRLSRVRENSIAIYGEFLVYEAPGHEAECRLLYDMYLSSLEEHEEAILRRLYELGALHLCEKQ